MSISAAKKISILNGLAYLISIFSLTLGILVYFITSYRPILFVELFIGFGLLTVPFLNRQIGYRNTLFFVFIILNAALVFYGIILGPQAQIHIVIGCLIGGAWILTDNLAAKIAASCYTISMILFLQVSYYYRWFTPLKLDYQSQMVVTWVVIFTGSSLTCSVLYYYFKYWVNAKESRLISELEKANQNNRIYVREIGHELRNEITAISSMAQLLNEAQLGESIGENKHLIGKLTYAAHQLTLTCNNLLNQAREEGGITHPTDKTSFSIREFLENNIELNQYVGDSKDIILNLDTEGMPTNIISDQNKLRQILNNLLSNAIKYSLVSKNEKSSIISIKARTTPGDGWMLEVTDYGPGMSAEKQKQVFNPFFTDENMQGTGLGLAISQRLAGELQGQIFVRSIEGEGSTFTAVFKMLEADLDPTIVKNEFSIANFNCQNSKILIIEDNEMNCKLIKLALEPLCNTVFTASNGFMGLQIATNESPDIILLDYNLPDMNGLAILNALKKNPLLNHIQVFMISGNENEKDREQLIAAGAQKFIQKPFNIQELRSIVSHCLSKKAC